MRRKLKWNSKLKRFNYSNLSQSMDFCAIDCNSINLTPYELTQLLSMIIMNDRIITRKS